MTTSLRLAVCGLLLLTADSSAQKKDSPEIKPPDEKTLELAAQRMTKLREAIAALPEKTPEYLRTDVEIYLKAAEWVARHKEWVHNDSGKWLLATLDLGLQRARDAAQGKAPWREPAGKTVSFAYRSKIDGSVQPYAVTFPLDYDKDPKKKKWRLDVVLHGRDGTICETKFLYQHNGKPAPKDNDFVQIDIYGRGNNAYRWAGERDVFEAMNDFIAVEKQLGRDLIDRSRIVLRGFSMGGAGTWHLGLHHPDKWCVIGPGAGFTTTHGYIAKLPNPLPPYQESLLHIYDAVDYAANAFNVPIVAYSGEKDAQKAAADNIEKCLKELKIERMSHLIGPELAHQFPPAQQKRAEAEYLNYAGPGKGRAAYPDQVRFVTYTLKYPKCDWIEMIALERHYSEALINAKHDGKSFAITTKNIEGFILTPPASLKPGELEVTIDGQKTQPASSNVYIRENGRWGAMTKPLPLRARKVHDLQGPIDDAFTNAFLCVHGTGRPYHDGPATSVEAQFKRFEQEWDTWMRGKLPIKSDNEVTQADIENKHLILFGDPASNSLIAKVLPKLPITWNEDKLVVGGQHYESAKYLPMLIYPNPLSPTKYIVLNSGHTFHDADFKGTNALLYPRLGDFAVVRPTPTDKDPAAFEVMKAGIFTDDWRFPEK
jgi:pimeloyl-ACP methyl ester carboxylesterase